jgi:predicted 3-demethylubiquinone-9 3-methyltransferase (glyoxalase superfamily)
MKEITPFLWFDNNAEEAANFYVSIFKNSKVLKVTHYGGAAAQAARRPESSVMTVEFELNGQKFVGLNGGPIFKFTEAVSFAVNCDTQEEIDYFWEKLSGDGGKEVECGWLKDKYGLSWQIVPTILDELVQASDPEKTNRVMGALMQMKKLNIAKLKEAAAGK